MGHDISLHVSREHALCFRAHSIAGFGQAMTGSMAEKRIVKLSCMVSISALASDKDNARVCPRGISPFGDHAALPQEGDRNAYCFRSCELSFRDT